MAFPKTLLDASWTIQRVPSTKKRLNSLHTFVNSLANQNNRSRQLQILSQECYDHLQSRTRAEPQDELNDLNERTGQLRECAISPMQSRTSSTNATSNQRVAGFVIETVYQKTTHQTILLTTSGTTRNECPISMILSRGNKTHLKHVEEWLELKFSLPPASQLQLSQQLLLRIFSEYLSVLTSSSLQSANTSEATRQAMLKQVIGTFKMTMTFSNAAGTQVAPLLRTMELDIPAETVDALLSKAQNSIEDGARNFLLELTKVIYDKTGLKLPLMIEDSIPSDVNDVLSEPPLKVTKITCAAFAASGEGKVKFASKPIEQAETIGYDVEAVDMAYWSILDIVREEAQKISVEG